MPIKQALPVFSNYKEILTQGRNKENKNGGEDYVLAFIFRLAIER